MHVDFMVSVHLLFYYLSHRRLSHGLYILQSKSYRSYAAPPQTQNTGYVSDTEFGKMISGMDFVDVMEVMDELMTTLVVVNPRLYECVMRKLNKI